MLSRVVVIFSFVIITTVVTATPVEDKPLDCPEHEKYHKCILEVCYKKCSDLKFTPPCPAIAADCFKPGCECERNFLRNSNGVCVPTADCS